LALSGEGLDLRRVAGRGGLQLFVERDRLPIPIEQPGITIGFTGDPASPIVDARGMPISMCVAWFFRAACRDDATDARARRPSSRPLTAALGRPFQAGGAGPSRSRPEPWPLPRRNRHERVARADRPDEDIDTPTVRLSRSRTST